MPNTSQLRQLISRLSHGAQSDKQSPEEITGRGESPDTKTTEDNSGSVSQNRLLDSRDWDRDDVDYHTTAERETSPELLNEENHQTIPMDNLQSKQIQTNIAGSEESSNHGSWLEDDCSGTTSPDSSAQLPTPPSESLLVLTESFTETPEPPPEFVTPPALPEDSVHPWNNLTGGIQGSLVSSGFMESVLYLMSISTDLLLNSKASHYIELRESILNNIHYPLVK